ncbi:MAG: hypothetical protein IJ229_07340 [Clostridia bacterium]|nr:hypothetical protein [Clostridia bacterium]
MEGWTELTLLGSPGMMLLFFVALFLCFFGGHAKKGAFSVCGAALFLFLIALLLLHGAAIGEAILYLTVLLLVHMEVGT